MFFFHIAEIFDGVQKLRKKQCVLVSPTDNSGEKEMVQLLKFVLMGRPTHEVFAIYLRIKIVTFTFFCT